MTDWFRDALLQGVVPFDAELRALLEGRVRDTMDMSGLGLEGRVSELVDEFERSVQARVWMECARRAGIPFSEARRRWSDPEDIAAEIAYSAVEAGEELRRCPRCGIDPAEVLDPETFRPLDSGRWKLWKTTCWVCGELTRARSTLDDGETRDGTDYRIVPRKPGDPWRDESDR